MRSKRHKGSATLLRAIRSLSISMSEPGTFHQEFHMEFTMAWRFRLNSLYVFLLMWNVCCNCEKILKMNKLTPVKTHFQLNKKSTFKLQSACGNNNTLVPLKGSNGLLSETRIILWVNKNLRPCILNDKSARLWSNYLAILFTALTMSCFVSLGFNQDDSISLFIPSR